MSQIPEQLPIDADFDAMISTAHAGATAPASRDPHLGERLEVWGGVECTVNRVGDTWHDQLERTGHAWRATDIEQFAGLGIRRMRYPLLWERIAPDGVMRADWSWADDRLKRLKAAGIAPIAGLVHHGSGPRGTDLLDPAWPERLAEYAGAVARRYPWIDAWTPVNEPLTTARFSALYGHWYPHRRDDLSFARAMLNQIRGVVLAMQAIREVNPGAQLVQTEDLGHTRACPSLQYQADFENERRWLTFDLLQGIVTADHPMRSFLQWTGIDASELQWFADHACPPDIAGMNYYVLSERYLDDSEPAGGNGRDSYADRGAVRACGLIGIAGLLKQAWQRIGRPLAITEAHLAGTRDEQLRWLTDIWDGAGSARREGVPVRAVTVWALLGAYDWDSLCTRCDQRYEAGAFDVRSGTPRPTAIAHAVRQLVAGQRPSHPVLARAGWWRR